MTWLCALAFAAAALAAEEPAPSPAPFALDSGDTRYLEPGHRDRATALRAKLRAGQAVDVDDVKAALDLVARYPRAAGLEQLAEAVLLASGRQAIKERRFTDALTDLREAAHLRPRSLAPTLALLDLSLHQGDWAEAESRARDVLRAAPENGDAWLGLGYALLRQDRLDEAGEALGHVAEDAPAAADARRLLERLRRSAAQERGLSETRASHFSLHHDGEAHRELGARVLEQLEEAHADLVRWFGYQPENTIPVVLLTGERYYAADGAPAWSGGAYDAVDGRVRVPVLGLTAKKVPDLRPVLVHELAHVFIDGLGGGRASRELHEGLAQYLEGRRLPPGAVLRAQASLKGSPEDVREFYRAALGFATYLVDRAGEGTLAAYLHELGEAGEPEASQRAFGLPLATLREEWLASLGSGPEAARP